MVHMLARLAVSRNSTSGTQRYIKTNNSILAYVLHILNNLHEYGNTDETVELLKSCNKGTKMNCWELLFIHTLQQGILIKEPSLHFG